MTLPLTPIWFVALPLLLAFASPLWTRLRLLMPVLLGAQAALFALSLAFYHEVAQAPVLETIVIAPPLGIHLHLDRASLLMVGLFSFAGALTALFIWLGRSEAYLRGRGAFVLLLLLLAGANGMVLTGDLFNLYVFLEIAGVSAYALSALKQDKPGLEAGLKYLLIGAVAAVFFLFAVVLLYVQTGELNMAAVAAQFATIPLPLQILIGMLLLVGLGIKTELVPFNFWVPDIYQGSDPTVTSLFAGIVVKAFLFVTFHLVFVLLADPTVVQTWLMGLGAATMLAAELVALRQQDIRRMLAYSSLGQVGLIAMALAFGQETTSAGALFHIINHTLVKLLLFLLAALLIRRYGSAQLAALRGSAQDMPLAAGLFVLASIAVLGLPPLSGFISKLWILQGFAAADVFWPVALILLAALIEAGYYFRWIQAFYATDAPDRAGSPVGTLAYLPLLILAGGLLVLGVAPFLLEPALLGGAEDFLDRAQTLNSVLKGQP